MLDARAFSREMMVGGALAVAGRARRRCRSLIVLRHRAAGRPRSATSQRRDVHRDARGRGALRAARQEARPEEAPGPHRAAQEHRARPGDGRLQERAPGQARQARRRRAPGKAHARPAARASAIARKRFAEIAEEHEKEGDPEGSATAPRPRRRPATSTSASSSRCSSAAGRSRARSATPAKLQGRDHVRDHDRPAASATFEIVQSSGEPLFDQIGR